MDLKPGKLLKVSYTNSKYSLTTVSGASSTSDGLRSFQQSALPLAKDQPAGRIEKEKMGVDRAHTEEAETQHH